MMSEGSSHISAGVRSALAVAARETAEYEYRFRAYKGLPDYGEGAAFAYMTVLVVGGSLLLALIDLFPGVESFGPYMAAAVLAAVSYLIWYARKRSALAQKKLAEYSEFSRPADAESLALSFQGLDSWLVRQCVAALTEYSEKSCELVSRGLVGKFAGEVRWMVAEAQRIKDSREPDGMGPAVHVGSVTSQRAMFSEFSKASKASEVADPA